jgi:hypothetical protein
MIGVHSMTDAPTMTLGGVELKTPSTSANRFSLLLWGSSGSGKTTLASTAPGPLVWINFDPDGTDALTNRDDIHVLDFANAPNEIVMKFRKENPLRLKEFLKENPHVKTLVVDSLTTFGAKALMHGVVEAQGTSKGRSSTIEDPGYSGYGNKNTWTTQMVKNILKVTGQAGVNVIFVAHEDKPVTNDSGVVLYISIMVGSSLQQSIPVDLSEIWLLEDTGKARRIAVRSCRSRRPMKSRMFITSGDPEFEWKYDADKLEGEGIETWYDKYVKNGRKKIDIPS